MDPIEAKKRKMEERAASRREKLLTESGQSTENPDATPPSEAQDSPATAPPPSTPRAIPPTPPTVSPLTPKTTPGASAPSSADGGPSNKTLAIIAVVLLVIVIGIVATRGDETSEVADDPIANGNSDPIATPPADPIATPPADPPADPPVDPPVDVPVDPPSITIGAPAEAGIESATRAVIAAAPGDPNLEALRTALRQEIAQIEIQGRALTSLEHDQIARARKALGGVPAPLDPTPASSPIVVATRALIAAAPDDPKLEALRTALRQEIAQIEIQGRALTSLERDRIARAREALGGGGAPLAPDDAPSGPRHGPPTDLAATSVAPKSINLTWKPSEDLRGCLITGYSIERKARGQLDWAEVGSIPDGAPTEFVDRDVDDGVGYRYRITASVEIDPDDQTVKDQGLVLPPGMARKSSAEIGPVRSIRGVYVVPTTFVEPTTEQPEKSVYVRVYVWDSVESEFISKSFLVKVGETIGAVVRKKGRDLDFSTHAVLLSAEAGKRKHPTQDFMQDYTAIKVKWADGTEEEITDSDVPEAVKKKR